MQLRRFHRQEVVDSEGRQRFHGAFTGGWSAGYYNTAGSAEGWAPSTFKSTRAERGAVKCVSDVAFQLRRSSVHFSHCCLVVMRLLLRLPG